MESTTSIGASDGSPDKKSRRRKKKSIPVNNYQSKEVLVDPT